MKRILLLLVLAFYWATGTAQITPDGDKLKKMRHTVVTGQPIDVPADGTCFAADCGVLHSDAGDEVTVGAFWFVEPVGSQEVLACVFYDAPEYIVAWGILQAASTYVIEGSPVALAEATIGSLSGGMLFLAKYASPSRPTRGLLVLSCGGTPYYAFGGNHEFLGSRRAVVARARKHISTAVMLGKINGTIRISE